MATDVSKNFDRQVFRNAKSAGHTLAQGLASTRAIHQIFVLSFPRQNPR
jgi:hypothetical protein